MNQETKDRWAGAMTQLSKPHYLNLGESSPVPDDPNTDLRAVAYESADTQKRCCLGEFVNRVTNEAEEEAVRRTKILAVIQLLHESRQHPETVLSQTEVDTLVGFLDSLSAQLVQLTKRVDSMTTRIRTANIALTGSSDDEDDPTTAS